MRGPLQGTSSFPKAVSLTKESTLPTNLHTQAFSAETLAELTQHLLAAIGLVEPRATPRTPTERREMLSLGPKSISFTQRTHKYAVNNPQIRPPFLDMDDYTADTSDAVGLWEILNYIEQLRDYVRDIQMVAGSESYHSSLLVYNTSKVAAAQDIPGAKAIYADLKTRFPSVKRKTTPETGTQE
jgi:hypothetical protein